jgi:hypothetical protein
MPAPALIATRDVAADFDVPVSAIHRILNLTEPC